MDAKSISQFQETHVAAWNERDRTKRNQLLKTVYHDRIKMHDPETTFNSLTEVSDFIGALHVRDPGFLFSAARPADSTQNSIRLYGHIGTKQKPEIMHSMDFFMLEDGKAVVLYVFIEVGK